MNNNPNALLITQIARGVWNVIWNEYLFALLNQSLVFKCWAVKNRTLTFQHICYCLNTSVKVWFRFSS